MEIFLQMPENIYTIAGHTLNRVNMAYHTVCSDIKQFEHNAIEMARYFLIRGYPPVLIETAMIRVRGQNRDDLLKHRDKPETIENRSDSVFLITRYTPGPYVLGNIVQKKVPYLTNNPQYRYLRSLEIKEVFVGHAI